MSASRTLDRKPDGLTGAERQEARLAEKANANAFYYRGIPQVGASSLYEADLRQSRRRAERKAAKAKGRGR